MIKDTTMRTSRVFLVSALALSIPLASSLHAVDVVTDPVGFHKIAINPGANLISTPLHKLHAFRGVVASGGVTASSVTVVGNPGWSANQFGPQDGFDQYLLLIRRDASAGPGAGVEGDWWVVTANDNDTVTVDAAPDNLTTLLAEGDKVEIRRLSSIQDLFGNPSILIADSDGDPNPAQEDIIRYVTGTGLTKTVFFHNSGGGIAPTGWYVDGSGPYDGSTITVFPDQAILVLRKTGTSSTNAVSIGQVQVTRLTHFLQPGANIIGTGFPAGSAIGASGLTPPGSGWISDADGDPNTSQEDIIRVFSPGGLTDTVFHHNSNGSIAPTGWYVNDTLNNDFALVPAAGYIFYRKTGSGDLRWRQTVPFTP